MKRYIVEIGTGADLHGGDVTKAAKRAIADAMSHGCLCGVSDILDIHDPNRIEVAIRIGCPKPELVNEDELLSMIPVGKGKIDAIVEGGLSTTGLHVNEFGEGDRIVIAVASLTVYVDV
ncbi:Lin0512 family protein [Fusibacter paucivorans]|uniref:Lin0512 family protein n=1 Tax=Fusibacter paucivorans TaxID=76009 RepID=A0ABS5PVA9_9FIRM|nr:Lin0512 family protein [Fusibacter paucivorans]MBS7528586.1 Lin0512 family protein [Fusibacter paucivorans]